MGEPSSKQRNAEIKTMLDYGFSQFEQGLLIPANTVVETKTMDNTKPNQIELITSNDLTYVYEKGTQPKEKSRTVEISKKDLPYKPGEVIGHITVEMDDGFIIEGDLSVKQEIHALDYLDIFMKSMKDFFVS